jgi:CelD/BcsL family acetyltransferase involved in cellulose biosynthesis
MTMLQATQAAFDARLEFGEESFVDIRREPAAAQTALHLSVHEDATAIEREWRAFEQIADGTVFQSFDWVSIWLRHIGSRGGIAPAIVTGHDGHGEMLFLFPLVVSGGSSARRLSWLGHELCDYNGPLLAPDFGKRIDTERFGQIWLGVVRRLQSHPRLRFDVIFLDKMQTTVGAQPNPFIGLGVSANPNGAYLTHLRGDWEAFYAEKRSAPTRRRDRTKRKRLAEFGEIRLVSPAGGDEIAATLDMLMHQKSKAFEAMGVADIFTQPGHREFYQTLAARRELVHVSRLDVGSQAAAVNLGLIFRGSYYHLLASYDGGELSRFGPGAAHMHELLRYAIERGCGVFDFTIGDERYKQEWCDTRIALFDHVSPATLRGYLAAFRFRATSRVKRWIKQTPMLWSVASRLRVLIGPLMRRWRS